MDHDGKAGLQESEGSLVEKKHQDVSSAEKVATLDSLSSIDPAMNKLLNRKFDTCVLPWLFGMWLLSYIDRANIGNARIDGLATDLGLEGTQFNTALAVFYVAYMIVDIPSNLALKYLGAGIYLPMLLTGWGICSTFMGFVKSYGGLVAARFFLGLCEGGLLGGIVIYLTMFYERHELLWRIGLFYCAAPLSGAFGGLLATGLAEIRTPGYNGWPFIFFIEGAITVLFGLTIPFFLPSTPRAAKFLTPEERHAAVTRMQLDSQSSTSVDVESEKFDWHWVKVALTDVNVQVLSWTFMLIITSIYSFSLFLPTIIKSFGYSRVVAQLLTVPPNICGVITVLLVCWISDRTKQRGIYMLIGCTVAIAGYIMLISTDHQQIQYGGTFLVAAGIFPCSAMIMAWLANNMAPHYMRATGNGYQIMVANLGAFIATFTYISDEAPRFITGHAINIGVLSVAIIAISCLMMYNRAENKRRAEGKRDYRLQEESEDRLGSRHPNFRLTI